MAEGFSARGVPVFLVDVKGDLSGLCVAGEAAARSPIGRAQLGLGEYRPRSFPVVFWDVSASRGIRCAPPSRRWGRCCWPACWS